AADRGPAGPRRRGGDLPLAWDDGTVAAFVHCGLGGRDGHLSDHRRHSVAQGNPEPVAARTVGPAVGALWAPHVLTAWCWSTSCDLDRCSLCACLRYPANLAGLPAQAVCGTGGVGVNHRSLYIAQGKARHYPYHAEGESRAGEQC